jgi:Fe-S cluster assembly protein SufD
MEIKEVLKKLSMERKEPQWLLDKRLKYLDLYNSKQFDKYFKHGLSIILTTGNFNLDENLITQKPNIIIKSDKAIIKPIDDTTKEIIFSSNVNSDKFALMHKVSCFNFNLILIPKNTKTEIEISGNASFLHLTIIAEENSEVKIKERFNVKDLMSYAVEIIAKENSKIRYLSSTNASDNYFFAEYKADLEENAEIKWLTALKNGKFSRITIENNLNGINSIAKTATMSLLNNKSQAEIYTISRHNQKHTFSDTLSKGVVKDSSKLLIRGLTRVEKNAPNSDGYEKADILILDNAEADAIPNLEIENNEVRCTHGATIGQVEKEKLFYLMSRGLSEEEAKNLIVECFFEPIFKFFSDNETEIEDLRKVVTC